MNTIPHKTLCYHTVSTGPNAGIKNRKCRKIKKLLYIQHNIIYICCIIYLHARARIYIEIAEIIFPRIGLHTTKPAFFSRKETSHER
jgi:hypothetical protein